MVTIELLSALHCHVQVLDVIAVIMIYNLLFLKFSPADVFFVQCRKQVLVKHYFIQVLICIHKGKNMI